MDKFGHVIRKHRQDKKITLKEMAEKTGLSISFLSEIERDVSKPSMGSLRKIARTLGISLLSFSDSSEGSDGGTGLHLHSALDYKDSIFVKDVRIVRSSQRKKLGYPDRPGAYELLTPDLNRSLQVLYVTLEQGFETGPEPICDPIGEKFVLVLQGTYHTRINAEDYVLEVGDSIYYPANSEVFFKSNSYETVKLLLIVTPPGF